VSEKAAVKIFYPKNFRKAFAAFLDEKKYYKVFILCDEHTNDLCLPVLIRESPAVLPAIIIKIYAGEEHKNLQAAEYVWKRLTEENADRKSLLINLGGGMVCDLGGFVAATYKRGIDFIHIPTTLLAQSDAAIGGKQGIDFLHYKNQVGVFRQPSAIFLFDEFLSTVPPDQLKSGFAEIVKHAFIAGGKFRKRVYEISDLAHADWNPLIEESAGLKKAVVEKDPYEKGLRKVLNFGHTIGHAVESLLLLKKIETLHGFCVAIGMIGELYLSTVVCGLSFRKRDEATDFIRKHFPLLSFGEDDIDLIIGLMRQDKKNSEGKIKMVLLEKFGQPVIDCEVNEKMIREALQFILHLYQA
jgi:3-dehydroquinate synthase